jgi:D-inositol-3-phosphate glycosyltransferase
MAKIPQPQYQYGGIMKITIVGTAFPLRGGIAHYNALLAEALGKHHTVNTITFKRQYPSLLFPGKTQQESGEILSTEPAPELVDSVNPFNWVSVGNRLKRERPDLIIFKYWLPFFGPCFGTIARRARSNGHTKILFICDNVLPHETRPGDRMLTRYAFNAVDYFIVQSAAVERDLKSLFPSAAYRFAAHPVYNNFGTALDKLEARKRIGIDDERVLLFFGYIRRYKGLHVLLDAIHKIPSSFPLKLLVVGEFYDDESTYRARIAELNLGSRVTVVSDYVPNSKVREYFSAADVVVLPYISATQSGIAQIAYNFNKPIIATDVGGLAEIVKDGLTGYVVPPERPDLLAQAIQRFYEKGSEEHFVAGVQQEKLQYTWENLVTAIEDLAHQR